MLAPVPAPRSGRKCVSMTAFGGRCVLWSLCWGSHIGGPEELSLPECLTFVSATHALVLNTLSGNAAVAGLCLRLPGWDTLGFRGPNVEQCC